MSYEGKQVLDPCCGSRMFWFDKLNPIAIFGDIRKEQHTLCDGRDLQINPDTQMDFRDLPFEDESFPLVVFDPPHLERAGEKGWQALKYGKLNKETWRKDLAEGFAECFRVLKTQGILVFKWNEDQIPIYQILKLTPYKPLFGHISGKRSNTHWICFMKLAVLGDHIG